MSCHEKRAFSITCEPPKLICGHDRKCVHYLWTIYTSIRIRFGPKFYRQIVDTLMCTNNDTLVADLFYYKRYFMSLYDNNQTAVIEAFKSTSR